MKKPKDIKPLFSVKYDYDASLAEFVHQAGMLADTVDIVLKANGQGDVQIPDAVAEQLSKRLVAFNRARVGE